VVLVEDPLGAPEIDLAAGPAVPGQRRQPVEVVADDRIFGGHLGQARQAAELAVGFLAGLGRQVGGVDGAAELLDVAAVLAFIELPVDGGQLLAQDVLALGAGDLPSDVGLDLVLDVELVVLLDQLLDQLPHALADVGRLQQGLPFRRRARDGGGDQVRQERGVLQLGQGARHLVGDVRGLLDVDGEQLSDAVAQGQVLGIGDARDGVLQHGDARLQIRLVGQLFEEAHAAQAGGEEDVAAPPVLSGGRGVEDASQRPDRVQLADARIGLGGIALQREGDHA